MARPVHGLLRPQFLAVCCVCLLLLEVSECSRPSPSPADHVDDALALHRQLLLLDAKARAAQPPSSTEVVAGDKRAADADAAAAAPSSASATPARAVGAVVAASSWPRQTSDRAQVRAGMLLRSKLARRFLAGAGVDEAASGSATDASGASCRSYNPHINCPPASKP